MTFEIHIFPGDPDRGDSHDGYMFSVRMEDGRYYASECAFESITKAASVAATVAVLIRDSPTDVIAAEAAERAD